MPPAGINDTESNSPARTSVFEGSTVSDPLANAYKLVPDLDVKSNDEKTIKPLTRPGISPEYGVTLANLING